jgi:hypothetical protein
MRRWPVCANASTGMPAISFKPSSLAASSAGTVKRFDEF